MDVANTPSRRHHNRKLWRAATAAAVVLYLLAAVHLAILSRDQINPDGISYIQVARNCAAGRFDLAVNSYWGPLLSWILVPFVWLGWDLQLVVKVLGVVLGLGFAVATTPLGAGTHTIQIRARNTAGNHSSILDFTIEVLRAPSALTATTVSQARIDLSWTDNSDHEEGFRIERSPDGTTRWTEIATVDANVTTYEDIGLPGGTTQTYRVRAYGGTDSSVPSNMASATTPPYITFFPAIWSARD